MKPLALTNFAHSTQNSLVPSNHMAIAGSQTVNAQKQVTKDASLNEMLRRIDKQNRD